MNLKAWLLLTLGGLLVSTLIVSASGSFATLGLAKRIETLDHAGKLARQLERIERARRRYQLSGTDDDLETANGLIAETSGEVAKLREMSKQTGDQVVPVTELGKAFWRYRELLDAYAKSEARKTEASAKMSEQLTNLKVMATALKERKESDYHQSFALAHSIEDAEERLRTALRLAALAGELIVAQMSIERSVALFESGDELSAAEIPFEVGRIAEIADRIRHIERVSIDHQNASNTLGLPDLLVSGSNQFQSGYDSFRLATRDQHQRADEMAAVAFKVTGLIQEIKALQAKAAVRSSERTLALSLLGVASALVLGFLAVVIMRDRVIRPLSAITRTMREMSYGQLEIAVPGRERRDELGAMAKALEVFRKNSLEARRLAEENVKVERRLAEERVEAQFLEQSLEKEKELNAQQRRFVSLVSHEIRTPLAIIDGQAQRLIRKGDKLGADDRIESLQKVRSSVNRLTDLMESVLSSASLEAGSITYNAVPMDLRALVQKACDGQQEISERHRINADIECLPEAYLGDPKLLFQVATNLLSNAVKYSPHADRVDVTAASGEGGLQIAVRDYGVGIPKDELPKICQRFFRARTSSGIQGTGIGLNLVRALVEMHGGTIEVTSIEGEGSTFTVTLPHKSVSGEATVEAA